MFFIVMILQISNQTPFPQERAGDRIPLRWCERIALTYYFPTNLEVTIDTLALNRREINLKFTIQVPEKIRSTIFTHHFSSEKYENLQII